jgi:hypothetical protein
MQDAALSQGGHTLDNHMRMKLYTGRQRDIRAYNAIGADLDR